MNKLTRVSLVAVAPLFALFAAPVDAGQLAPGLYAMMQTSKGDILLELFYQDTPMTVANFVGLAEGTIDNSAKQPGQPYYDGIVFHRVIADFMIQGGDPTGTGRSGPGYNFADEFRPHLRHNAPGILSMANAGPGTNGSQFFITHVPTPHLDDHHTVFGKVVSGQNVVDAIRQGDSITKLSIIRVGPEAERFVVDTETFQRLQEENASGGAKAVSRAPAAATESAPTSDADYGKLIRRYQKEAKTSRTGLKYVILKEGEGNPPREGQTIQAEYTGRFMDGRVFDSSLGRQPLSVKVGKGQVIAGWDEALSLMKVGEKRALIIPSKLAYGKQGMGGVIPPDATLFFEVERVK